MPYAPSGSNRNRRRGRYFRLTLVCFKLILCCVKQRVILSISTQPRVAVNTDVSLNRLSLKHTNICSTLTTRLHSAMYSYRKNFTSKLHSAIHTESQIYHFQVTVQSRVLINPVALGTRYSCCNEYQRSPIWISFNQFNSQWHLYS
jgi:hypothetical protein